MMTKKEQKIQSKLEAHLVTLRESLKNAEACRSDWYDANSDKYDKDGMIHAVYVMELLNVSSRVNVIGGQIRLIEDVLEINVPPRTTVIYSNKQESYV